MTEIECIFYCLDSSTNQKQLFSQALSTAKNGKVLYILREELNELPELSQDLTAIDRHYMKMISFLYVNSLQDFIESISTLPEWQNIPCTLIVEDLGSFCGKNLQNACGLVAMLIDALHNCTLTLNTPGKLSISLTKGSSSEEYYNTLIELYGTIFNK